MKLCVDKKYDINKKDERRNRDNFFLYSIDANCTT